MNRINDIRMKSLYKKHFNWYERNLKYTKEQMAKQLFEIGVINNFISHRSVMARKTSDVTVNDIVKGDITGAGTFG